MAPVKPLLSKPAELPPLPSEGFAPSVSPSLKPTPIKPAGQIRIVPPSQVQTNKKTQGTSLTPVKKGDGTFSVSQNVKAIGSLFASAPQIVPWMIGMGTDVVQGVGDVGAKLIGVDYNPGYQTTKDYIGSIVGTGKAIKELVGERDMYGLPKYGGNDPRAPKIPTKYVNAYESGESLIPLFIEDVGNISMVGSITSFVGKRAAVAGSMAADAGARQAASAAAKQAAAEGLGAADVAAASKAAFEQSMQTSRAAAFSNRARIVAEAGKSFERSLMPIANLPFKPYVLLGKGAGSLIRNGVYVGHGSSYFGWGMRAGTALRKQVKELKASGVLSDDPIIKELNRKIEKYENRATSQQQKKERNQAGRDVDYEKVTSLRAITEEAQNPVHKDVINPETGEVFGELSGAEQAAIIALVSGPGKLVNFLTSKMELSPQTLAILGRYDFMPGFSLTSESAKLVTDFLNHTDDAPLMSREQYERISNAAERVVKTVVGKVTQKAIRGVGRRNPLDPNQLVPTPPVEALTARIEDGIKHAERQLDKMRRLKAETPAAKAVKLRKVNHWQTILASLKEVQGSMAELADEGIWELPVDNANRLLALQQIVQALPDNIALDSSMYPAAMRPNVEWYKRLRQSLNRSLYYDATGKKLPDFADPDFDPTDFTMNMKSGRIDAVDNLLNRMRDDITVLEARIKDISERIDRKLIAHEKATSKLHIYDMVEQLFNGKTIEQLAKKYKVSAKALYNQLVVFPSFRAWRDLQQAKQEYASLQAVLGDSTVDPMVLADEYNALKNKAEEAQRKYDEALKAHDEQRILDEAEVDKLNGELDDLESDLSDHEYAYEDAGGVVDDLWIDDESLDPNDLGNKTPEELDQIINTDESNIEAGWLEIEKLENTRNELQQEISRLVQPSLTAKSKKLKPISVTSPEARAAAYIAALREAIKTGKTTTAAVNRIEKLFDTGIGQLKPKAIVANAEKLIFKYLKPGARTYIRTGLVNGKLWWTNGYIALNLELTPKFAEQMTEEGRYQTNAKAMTDALLQGIDKTDSGPAAISQVINKNATIPLEPIGVNAIDYQGEKTSIVVLRDVDGNTVGIDKDNYDLLPEGSKLLYESSKKPISIYDAQGNLIGIVMPIKAPASGPWSVPTIDQIIASTEDVIGVNKADFVDGKTVEIDVETVVGEIKTRLSEVSKKIEDVQKQQEAKLSRVKEAKAQLNKVETPEPTPKLKPTKAKPVDSLPEGLNVNKYGLFKIGSSFVEYYSQYSIDEMRNIHDMHMKITEFYESLDDKFQGLGNEEYNKAIEQEFKSFLKENYPKIFKQYGDFGTFVIVDAIDELSYRLQAAGKEKGIDLFAEYKGEKTPKAEPTPKPKPEPKLKSVKPKPEDIIPEKVWKGPTSVDEFYTDFSVEQIIDISKIHDNIMDEFNKIDYEVEGKLGKYTDNEEYEKQVADKFGKFLKDNYPELVKKYKVKINDFESVFDLYQNISDANSYLHDAGVDLGLDIWKKTKPKSPDEVVMDPKIRDPKERAAAYDSDLIDSLDAEASAAMDAAETAYERLQALDKFIESAQDQIVNYQKVFEYRENIKAFRKESLVRLEKIRELKNKKKELEKTRKNALRSIASIEADPRYEAIQAMTGSTPLDVALEGGYPTEVLGATIDTLDGENVNLIGPMYLPSGRAEPFFGGVETQMLQPGFTGWQMLDSEHVRTGKRHVIYNFRDLALRVGKEVARMESNERYQSILRLFGKTAADHLTPEVTQRLYDEAFAYVTENPPDGIAAPGLGVTNYKAAFNMAVRQRYGELIGREMESEGYIPVDVYKPIESGMPGSKIMSTRADLIPEDASTTLDVPAEETTHNTLFIPKSLKRNIAQIEQIADPTAFDKAMAAAAKVTGAMKTTTLAFSITWQLGDLVSAVIIAQMTGVDVKTMINQMNRVRIDTYGTGFPGLKRMVVPSAEMMAPGPTEALLKQMPIQDLGLAQAENQWIKTEYARAFDKDKPAAALPGQLTGSLVERIPVVGQVVRAGKATARVSFKLNETINKITRHAYALELLERELSARGLVVDDLYNGEWVNDSNLSELVFEVADTANKWLGDFGDLSVQERNRVAPLIPFYAWTKHIHKVFYSLGVEHPASLAWYAYIGSIAMNGREDDDPFNLRRGGFNVFGGVASSNWMNPLGDIFSGPILGSIAEGSLRPAGSTLGPVPRLAGGIVGFNVAAAKPLSRPAGTGGYSETGTFQSGGVLPLLGGNLQETLGFTAQQFPLTQRILNVLPGENIPGTRIALGPVSRYDTGEARLKPGLGRQRIEQPGGRLAALGRFFSAPFIPTKTDQQIEDIMKSARGRLATLEQLQQQRNILGAP